MTDGFAQEQDDLTPEQKGVDQNAPNDDLGGNQDLSAALDKLYAKLPKYFARLRPTTPEAELVVTLKILFTTVDKINDLEKQLLPDDQKGQYTDISLSRIYEMADQGGGSSDVAELQQANTAFAEQNSALTEAVNSLTFQIKTLKRQAADEILGKESQVPTLIEALKNSVKDVPGALAQINAFIAKNVPSEPQAGDKGLDERFIEALSGMDISPDLLDATPSSTTLAGRILRKFGFAYDYKDIATVRPLVASVLKANKKLAELSRQAMPSAGQVNQLATLLSVVELYVGHDERQSVQYKEALEQVHRLQTQIDALEEKQGSLTALDERIQTRQHDLESLEADTTEVIAAREKKLAEIQANIDEILKPLTEMQEEQKKLNEEVERLKKSESTLQKRADELDEKNNELAKTELHHRQEIAGLHNRMRDMEGGLLIEKLENEIAALRAAAQPLDDARRQAIAEKEAFEARIETWVSSEDTYKKEVKKWQKRSALKLSYAAAACAVTGIAGDFVGGSTLVFANAEAVYMGLMMGIPALVVGTIAVIKGNDLGEKVIGGLGGAFISGMIGGLMGLVGTIPLNADTHASRDQYNRDTYSGYTKFLQNGQTSPFNILKDTDGTVQIEYLGDKYKGKQVTFDFTDPDHPKAVVTETNALDVPRPTGKNVPVVAPAPK